MATTLLRRSPFRQKRDIVNDYHTAPRLKPHRSHTVCCPIGNPHKNDAPMLTTRANRLGRLKNLPTKTDLIVVVAIIGVLAVVLYPAIQASRHPDGPLGSPFPTEPPHESRRHRNFTGVSMVLPPNWVENTTMTELHRLHPEGNHIWFSAIPRTTPGRRPSSAIDVRFHSEPFHEINTTFTPREFAGLPAFERTLVNTKIGDPYVSQYLLYAKQDDGWWFVQYSTDRRRLTSLPAGVQQYIETIRLPRPKEANHAMQRNGGGGVIDSAESTPAAR